MSVQDGIHWLESIEVRMRDAIAKGAVPTPEQVTGRELLSRFGFQRRGTYINSLIHNELERLKLSVVPDFVVTWVDNPIVIRLDNDAADSDRRYVAPDPTHRIGSLAAANNPPVSVRPETSLIEATTIMHYYDYSQLPVMQGKRDVTGIISWKSIGGHLSLGQVCASVKDCIDQANELPVTASLFDAIVAIAGHEYVLVRGDDRAITGIVTVTDLSFQLMQLAGPFLWIGEIEGRLPQSHPS